MRGLVVAHVEILPARLIQTEVIALKVGADIVGPEINGVTAISAARLHPELFQEHAARNLAVLVHLLIAVGGVWREPERIGRRLAEPTSRLLHEDVGARVEGAVPIPA